jgi:hypothetical protein
MAQAQKICLLVLVTSRRSFLDVAPRRCKALQIRYSSNGGDFPRRYDVHTNVERTKGPDDYS